MTTKYDLLQHQVIPILKETANHADTLRSSGKKVESAIDDVTSHCRSGDVRAALDAFKGNVLSELVSAVNRADRVVMAGAQATREYVLADFHMTARAEQALRKAIPLPLNPKLDHLR